MTVYVGIYHAFRFGLLELSKLNRRGNYAANNLAYWERPSTSFGPISCQSHPSTVKEVDNYVISDGIIL